MTISSTKYEILVKDLIDENFGNYIFTKSIFHDKKYLGKSGHEHQIDVSAEIKLGSVDLLILVECKYYSKKVSIKEVLEFSSRINDISANKGILVSTVGFQKGAIKFAKVHRIALIKVYDGCYVPMTGGGGHNPLFEWNIIELFEKYFTWYTETFIENKLDEELKSKISRLANMYQYKADFCSTKFNGNTEEAIVSAPHKYFKSDEDALVFYNFCYSFISEDLEFDVHNFGIFDYCIIEYILSNH